MNLDVLFGEPKDLLALGLRVFLLVAGLGLLVALLRISTRAGLERRVQSYDGRRLRRRRNLDHRPPRAPGPDDAAEAGTREEGPGGRAGGDESAGR